jgi:hypothetical protein
LCGNQEEGVLAVLVVQEKKKAELESGVNGIVWRSHFNIDCVCFVFDNSILLGDLLKSVMGIAPAQQVLWIWLIAGFDVIIWCFWTIYVLFVFISQ